MNFTFTTPETIHDRRESQMVSSSAQLPICKKNSPRGELGRSPLVFPEISRCRSGRLGRWSKADGLIAPPKRRRVSRAISPSGLSIDYSNSLFDPFVSSRLRGESRLLTPDPCPLTPIGAFSESDRASHRLDQGGSSRGLSIRHQDRSGRGRVCAEQIRRLVVPQPLEADRPVRRPARADRGGAGGDLRGGSGTVGETRGRGDAGTGRKGEGANMTRVAVLCAGPRSNYLGLDGVDIFDRKRDARTFERGMPVIAHPPCRAWSVRCKHQAKPEPGEKELGIWCADQLRRWGGILEQPAHSELFAAAGLPIPGKQSSRLFWAVEVWQGWWGTPTIKRTWLAFCGIDRSQVNFPFKLCAAGGDKRAWKCLSAHQRSRTPVQFASWLVSYARTALPSGGIKCVIE